jgi:hypothetical protein
VRGRNETIASLVLIAVSVLALLESRNFPTFGMIMPALAAYIAILCGSLLILKRLLERRAVRDGRSAEGREDARGMEDEGTDLPPFFQAFVGIFVLGFGSVLLSLHILGIYAGSVVAFIVLRWLQPRKPSLRVLAIQSLTIAGLIYALSVFLGVSVPGGVVFAG